MTHLPIISMTLCCLGVWGVLDNPIEDSLVRLASLTFPRLGLGFGVGVSAVPSGPKPLNVVIWGSDEEVERVEEVFERG